MSRMTRMLMFSLTAGALVLGGCATNSAVDERIAQLEGRTNQKIESVEGQVEDLQEQQRATEQRLDTVSKEASEALRRAEEAGLLAQGKIVFEQAFTEDRIRFALGKSDLTAEARAALDELASRIKAVGRPVFIEIQGHTDSTGSARFNEELGFDRAEAVRRYLSSQHNLPLARMSTISYGETSPVTDNRTRDARMQNRRVVVVVLE